MKRTNSNFRIVFDTVDSSIILTDDPPDDKEVFCDFHEARVALSEYYFQYIDDFHSATRKLEKLQETDIEKGTLTGVKSGKD